MAKPEGLTEDNETQFEDHFCNKLDVNGGFRVRHESKIDTDKELCIYFEDLEEFLESTQRDKLRALKEQFSVQWKEQFKQAFREALAEMPLFMVLKKGVQINELHFDLIYFKPERESNSAQQSLYKRNRYTAIRQWYFGKEVQNKSLDIVLSINGFVVVTIELKNQGTSGDYTKAIEQYLKRDLSLSIFQQPFLHIVCDNDTVKMAAAFGDPPSEKDFRDFNQELVNVPKNDREYPVHYLYDEILLPDSLLNYIKSYLYQGSGKSWIFPRYHQQRATRKVVNEIKKRVQETGELDVRFLVQHSTGSGKSNTIVWMAQNLRDVCVGDKSIFDSIVVLTDRINLDDQISKDFQKAILTEGVAQYAEKTSDLKEALEANKKVIVSTIHKFSHLKELADQSGKKICVIIDEAHRSQEGKLHEGVTGTFSNEEGVEPSLEDRQEELIAEIERKKFPNMAFIALTATPSDKTLEHFGKKATDEKGKPKWAAHDVYSMNQAIAEGYIMDVSKRIYSYDTLYELNKDADTKKEYLPMMVKRALRQKAFEDSEIIKEKCNRIVSIFKNESARKINGRSKAMVVSSSRLAAVKYKLFMDEEIKRQGLKYKTLVAFSGSIDFEGEVFTEESMNRVHNPKRLKTEEVFELDDQIRFLIVANKFQTGFDEPLLHTMFLDKPVRDRTAVQTLSRLNRIHQDKKDTLVVDFTGSYEQIMKAYSKYQDDVTTHKSSDPNQLYELKAALLRFGIFTESEIREVAELGRSKGAGNMPAIAGMTFAIKKQFDSVLSRENRDEFRILMNRYLAIFNYIQAIFHIPNQDLWDFQIFMIYLKNKLTNSDYNSLKKELEDVEVVNHSIHEVERDDEDSQEETGGSSSGGSTNVTKVRETRTVKEVIEEINLRFKERIGDNGVEVIGEFLELVTTDEEMIQTMKANIEKDPDKVFEEIFLDRFKAELTVIVMDKAPERYSEITGEPVFPYICKTAYKLLRIEAQAA